MGPKLMPFLASSFATAALWLLWANPSTESSRFNPGRAYDRAPNVTAAAEVFSWDAIIPTAHLVWHPCHVTFQCARLEVPLNYSESHGRKGAIALIRKPAIVPERSPFYRGPVLINPGGPGGSGVNVVLSIGNALATILGPQFDVVGFDPRGIAASTPRATFFENDAERSLYFDGQTRVMRPGTVSRDLAKAKAEAQVLGGLAASRDDGYLKHINTEDTATDMLRIARAHGREKIQYWGFSYGTILGATFAAMYPNNIERMVIDGVMESNDYYATTWLTNLADTNKGLDNFINSCAEAGPTYCALSSPDPENIRKNITALYERLLNEPLPAWANGRHGVIDYAVLRSAIFSCLYSPYSTWAVLAQALKDLLNGDGTALLSQFTLQPPKCSCDPDEGKFAEVREGFHAVHCNDGEEVPASLEALEEHYNTLTNRSDWGDIWATTRITCIGWPKMKKRFRGPFVGNTSHPLLVIGNTADPVTPLVSAKKMAEGFNGSVVLTQNSGGHCSINAPSICTQNYVRKYFQDGTLPEPGTVCDPIIKNPFFGLPGRRESGNELAQTEPEYESSDLRDAVSELASKSIPLRFGFPPLVTGA